MLRQCQLCRYAAVSDEDLAEHWDACFDDHCPTKAVLVRSPERRPRRFMLDARLGSYRLPPGAVVSLVDEALPFPARLALMQTSSVGRRMVDSLEAWESFVHFQWRLLLLEKLGSIPDGACGCRLSGPRAPRNAKEAKEAAMLLWRSLSVTTATCELRFWTGSKVQLPLKSLDSSPILASTTVRDLKVLIAKEFHLCPTTISIMKVGPMHLSHDAAPLAAYVWDLLSVSQTQACFSLETLPSTTTRRCSEARAPGGLVAAGAGGGGICAHRHAASAD